MKSNRLSHRRPIIERLIIQGDLQLTTPTCLSSGDTESPTDLPLLKDSISQRALLTGTSLSGALRNYLREYRGGYHSANESVTKGIFGMARSQEDDGDDQSPLIIGDALSRQETPHLELRDGVKIGAVTGVAIEGAKYDLELLAAGTVFPLYFELLIETTHDRDHMIEDLAIALTGLEKSEISIGMKKRRGFGQCSVSDWQVWRFDLKQAKDRYAWLTHQHWPEWASVEANHKKLTAPQRYDSIETALNACAGTKLRQPLETIPDQRQYFELSATFELEESLLIRATANVDDLKKSPDVVHLASRQPSGSLEPVLSGTSLAGVLRNRAIRILNTIGAESALVDLLFGPDFSEDRSKKPKASRLMVKESVIENTERLVQSRIAIDRCTGGALDGALFSEQPIFRRKDSRLTISLRLSDPSDAEIGLLLLLLKDLWTGDLPVGGGGSIGRGRLKGQQATLKRCGPEERRGPEDSSEGLQRWEIQSVAGAAHLDISEADVLQSFVDALFKGIDKRNVA